MGNVLGLMTNRLRNRDLFQAFYNVAREEGFADLLIFTPAGVDLKRKRVNGYAVRDGELVKQTARYPAISYDIGFYSDPQTIAKVRQIKKTPALPFINYGLGNKWTIHKRLALFPKLRPHLIPTEPIRDARHAIQLLENNGTLILKPNSGKRGQGIIRLSKAGNTYLLEKDLDKLVVPSAAELARRLRKLLQTEQYLGQKWIDIYNKHGVPYDIRSLLQKDGQGQWRLVGLAVRQGANGKVTSGLADGGTPYPLLPYLQSQFGRKHSRYLYQRLTELSLYIPPCLEAAYRRPQADLGIDLAIDKTGHIYIIEVNIKPGKKSFQDVFELQRDDVIRLPVQYAGYCLRSGKPGQIPKAVLAALHSFEQKGEAEAAKALQFSRKPTAAREGQTLQEEKQPSFPNSSRASRQLKKTQ
ncbi:YheC/YheD family protein [Brevibacillus marinus]|uniref:YheC/YheD family endospore coat-associated protein n=1 Tax=Brevibacillus marinus TaxID=2496837 RepID=UPI000F82583F|nr:YheC/YheD family protein [Brevibacillus marinus]